MIFVFILVFAVVCLCLWSLVKAGEESDESLMDMLAGEENYKKDEMTEPKSVFIGNAVDITKLSSEYSEELFGDAFGKKMFEEEMRFEREAEEPQETEEAEEPEEKE